MKKILTVFILVVMLSLSLIGCDTYVEPEQGEKEPTSMFVKVEDGFDYYIIYHKETRVMYAVSDGSYNHGTFTLLVDAEGNPMIWDKGEK